MLSCKTYLFFIFISFITFHPKIFAEIIGVFLHDIRYFKADADTQTPKKASKFSCTRYTFAIYRFKGGCSLERKEVLHF